MSSTEPATRDELVQHLERITGRTLKTREDIHAYVREMSVRRPREAPSVRRWIRAKHFTLVALLAFGIIQYYMLDVMLEIVSLPSPTFFVPASTPIMKSMRGTHGGGRLL